MVRSLVTHYSAIFFDEAEDLGARFINEIPLGLDLTEDKWGHLWILFDHLQQSSRDSGISRGGSYLKLDKIYRNSRKCCDFLRYENLISMYDPSTQVGHNIDGPEIQEVRVDLETRENLQKPGVTNKIVNDLGSVIMGLTGQNGIHPGDIAITFDECDYNMIFGQDESILQRDLDKKIGEMCGKHKKAPKATSNTIESIIFAHKRLTECTCKCFIGPYKRLKGLTVKVMIYISLQGSSRGHNRMSAYTALSRSSCSIIIFYVTVRNMNMLCYQKDKIEYLTKVHMDEGIVRDMEFSFSLLQGRKIGQGEMITRWILEKPCCSDHKDNKRCLEQYEQLRKQMCIDTQV